MLRATPFDLALLQAYDAKYLLGDIRDDFRTGLWCSTHINAKLKDGATPTRPLDFMPLYQTAKPKQTVQQMATLLKAWAKANGAEIPKGK